MRDMIMPKAVLFDLDGVLVKTEEAWFRVVSQSGVRFRGGKAVTRKEFAPTFGQGTEQDIVVFGLSCTREELDAFYELEFLRHLGTVWVNPDAQPLLEELKKRGVQTALVTNSVIKIARALVERAEVNTLLDVLATADRVKKSKPSPDLVELALKDLGVAPEDAWFVGDSRYDRGASEAAKVKFIGLGIDGDVRIERLAEMLS